MPSKRGTKNGARASHQAHMNKVKFDPYRYKLDDQKIPPSVLACMTSLCCRRCCEILKWKVDYGKYVQLQRRRKCNHCGGSSVYYAYHHICQGCAVMLRRCAKCQKSPGMLCGSTITGSGCGDGEEYDSEEEPEGGTSTPNQGRGESAITGKCNVDTSFLFVDEEDSDEEFKLLRGLDIRQLKARKQTTLRRQEQDRVGRLRERERRTVVRRAAKAPEGGGTDDFTDGEL